MRASIEVADIFRAAGPVYRAARAGHLSLDQLKIMSVIEHCRTAVMGGHVEACTDCGHWRVAYNSCRNRQGQTSAQARYFTANTTAAQRLRAVVDETLLAKRLARALLNDAEADIGTEFAPVRLDSALPDSHS